jgi:hypothetical protein
MKVGILTFPDSISYGAVLQMYALQTAVERLGHEAEVIHYHNAYMKAEKHIRKGQGTLRFVLQRAVRRWVHRPLYAAFTAFERQNVRLHPARAFSDRASLMRFGSAYDAVVCGSDQVWNPGITDTDSSYFLDFCGDHTRRVAYAPSFGVEELPSDVAQTIRPHLAAFDALSVREEAGRRLVQQVAERDAAVVVDPTLLLTAEDWMALERPHPAAVGEYIVYFTVRRSDALFARCVAWAESHGMKMLVVGGNRRTADRNRHPLITYVPDIGPQEWLYLMHHARYVVTNSFHGTAFSVIFEKDFFVEYPARTASRLQQVVEGLGFDSRVVREGEPMTEAAAPYDGVAAALNGMRQESLAYLSAALA